MAVAVDSPSGRRLWGARELIAMGQQKSWRLMDEAGWQGPAVPAKRSSNER
jgi:hypothetical protein